MAGDAPNFFSAAVDPEETPSVLDKLFQNPQAFFDVVMFLDHKSLKKALLPHEYVNCLGQALTISKKVIARGPTEQLIKAAVKLSGMDSGFHHVDTLVLGSKAQVSLLQSSDWSHVNLGQSARVEKSQRELTPKICAALVLKMPKRQRHHSSKSFPACAISYTYNHTSKVQNHSLVLGEDQPAGVARFQGVPLPVLLQIPLSTASRHLLLKRMLQLSNPSSLLNEFTKPLSLDGTYLHGLGVYSASHNPDRRATNGTMLLSGPLLAPGLAQQIQGFIPTNFTVEGSEGEDLGFSKEDEEEAPRGGRRKLLSLKPESQDEQAFDYIWPQVCFEIK